METPSIDLDRLIELGDNLCNHLQEVDKVPDNARKLCTIMRAGGDAVTIKWYHSKPESKGHYTLEELKELHYTNHLGSVLDYTEHLTAPIMIVFACFEQIRNGFGKDKIYFYNKKSNVSSVYV